MRCDQPIVLVIFVLLALGCGGSNPPAVVAGPTSIAAPGQPVTLCIAAALASNVPTDRGQCLLTVLDERELLAKMDPREQLREKIAESFTALGPDRVDTINAEVDRLFDPARMQASFEAKMIAGHDDALARRLLQYYATDLGTRYANANAAASSDDEEDAAASWLESHPIGDARKVQLDALMTAVRGPDLVHAMVVAPAVSMVEALSDASTPEARAAQNAQLEEALRPIITAVSADVVSLMGYMLRDFTDAELTQVIETERSPHAQWHSGLRLTSLQAVLGEAYLGLGRAIAAQRPANGAPN
jgi:hypothetical protein